jgi:hypothetical protein
VVESLVNDLGSRREPSGASSFGRQSLLPTIAHADVRAIALDQLSAVGMWHSMVTP